MFGREKLPVKTPDQIRAMRRAGLVVAGCLEAIGAQLAAGMSTRDVDALAERFIRDAGATPSFLGYQGYPASVCVSVNDVVVHGIPGEQVVADGDVVSVDCGAIVDGWHGDAARTWIVGTPDPRDAALSETTRRAMWAGIGGLRAGRGVYELGGDIEDAIREQEQTLRDRGLEIGFEIVDGYTGHGIGREMHMEPTVYNERVRPRGPAIRAGVTIAIEPMVTLGTWQTHELDDGWTVLTDDGSRAAHWENTVALTEHGLWVLTEPDGGRAELEARGLPYGALD